MYPTQQASVTGAIQFKVLTTLTITFMIKFENLKWWFGGDIILLTFRKFVTTLVQKLTGNQYPDWQYLLSLNILSFSTYHVINFPKVSGIKSSPNYHFRFPIFVLETFKLQWQCSQYLELNPTCADVVSLSVPSPRHQEPSNLFVPIALRVLEPRFVILGFHN